MLFLKTLVFVVFIEPENTILGVKILFCDVYVCK